MENENSQEEPPIKTTLQKRKPKKSKQATVLKQLNNQNLYPLQERIGIYVIAALSTIGLALITYTGVMALVSNATNGAYLTADVDVDELYEILEDLDDLVDDEDEPEEPNQERTRVEPDDEEDNVALETPDDDETDTTLETPDDEIATGVINIDGVPLYRSPNTDHLLTLHSGDIVTIIDLDSNIYWAHVEIETDAILGLSVVAGFVRRDFLDVD